MIKRGVPKKKRAGKFQTAVKNKKVTLTIFKSLIRNYSNNKKKNGNHLRKKEHPLFRQELTLGQKAADAISRFGGSWTFIGLFFFFLCCWIGINGWIYLKKPFDPYPFILLNLILSCLAAIQAPIILMTQNRQAERDRLDAKYDHAVNRRAEREIRRVQREINNLGRKIDKI